MKKSTLFSILTILVFIPATLFLGTHLRGRWYYRLTLGITPDLGIVSQIILIFLMYIGRVGGLTLIFSTVSGNRGNTARLPQEKLTVG